MIRTCTDDGAIGFYLKNGYRLLPREETERFSTARP
jgi:hypothetical protein